MGNWRDNWREILKNRRTDGRVCEVSVGDGWAKIVCDLVKALDASGVEWQPAQVKEKFGTLRFYVDIGDGPTLEGILKFENYKEKCKEAWKLIEDAEHKSASTCEDCGAAGDRVSIGHILATLCGSCAKAAQEKRDAAGKGL